MRKQILMVVAAALAAILGAGGAAYQQPAPAQQRPLVFAVTYERGAAWDAAKGGFQQTGITDHMQFLRTNGEKLLAGAPFQQGLPAGATDQTVGMILLLAATQEEAETLVASDPAVASRLMKATVRRWLVERVKGY
jgi:hypothetical protein